MKRIAILAAALGLSASAAVAAPNLVPGFNVKTGAVSVGNIGNTTAKPSVVTVECNGQGGASCPDPTPAQAAPYLFPGFPNVVSIKTSKLLAGGNFNHTINFFGSLNFAPGVYVFTVCADAGHQITESNEGDNCRRFRKVVRQRLTPKGLGLSARSN